MAILFNFRWIFEKLSVVLQNKTNTNMTFTNEANQIFERAINDYHVLDNVDTPLNNPYQKDSIQNSGIMKILSAILISIQLRHLP